MVRCCLPRPVERRRAFRCVWEGGLSPQSSSSSSTASSKRLTHRVPLWLQAVAVVDVMTEQLEAIVPSPQGDQAAGFAAVLAGLWSGAAATPGSSGVQPSVMHVDEALRAENAFLEVCDFAQVSGRLKDVAEARSERWASARVEPIPFRERERSLLSDPLAVSSDLLPNNHLSVRP